MGIATFQVVVSTTHGLMKFPTKRGIATLKPTAEALLIASLEEVDLPQVDLVPKDVSHHAEGGNTRYDRRPTGLDTAQIQRYKTSRKRS